MSQEIKTTNTVLSPSQTTIDVNKKVKDYNHSDLFDFLFNYHKFVLLFLDVQEAKLFITYLYENKGETIIKDLIEDSKSTVKEFKQNFYNKKK